MKRLHTSYYVYFILMCCILIASVGYKNTNKQKSILKNMVDKTKTIKNMLEAYSGEISASAKYESFAKQAEKENYHPIAILYKALSIAENIHASNHKFILFQ